MIAHLQNTPFVKHYEVLSMSDIASVGAKNAALGEMTQQLSKYGIRFPKGFCVSTSAFRHFLKSNDLHESINQRIATLDTSGLGNLAEVGEELRLAINSATMPTELLAEFKEHLEELDLLSTALAVRSSATAEDLPGASFAGQYDSFLNVQGVVALGSAVQRCFASLYNDRAIKYRLDHGISLNDTAISVGVQAMVRSDLASSGVIFSSDPETGFRRCFYLSSSWGLCENIVQGSVEPDEYYLYKPSIESGHESLVYRRLGTKERTMILDSNATSASPVLNVPTSIERQRSWSLKKEDAEILGQWCLAIEQHFSMPMDIEWAKDGESGDLFIVQARPLLLKQYANQVSAKEYHLRTRTEVLCKGKAVGRGVVCGRVCLVDSPNDALKVQQGDIIVADCTNPDWNTLLRKAVCIVTNKGGRTSHASIVARELGIPALVGTTNATSVLRDGEIVTVVCTDDEAVVYKGELQWELRTSPILETPITNTSAMLILADPDKAMRLSQLPNAGVGLMRMEFAIARSIRVHPMALVHLEKLPPDAPERSVIEALTQQYAQPSDYFVEKLSEAIAMVAAAFAPKPVIVRMSDFKSNEYAQLIGGKYFETQEENPMLGFRGASRYYHERYRDAFVLECAAVRRVRNELGLKNLKVMIPFCRTIEEASRVLETMHENGLSRSENGLEVYVMAEIPSNIILAEQFCALFDGFSIGSNDLTQLCLGVDRDSALLAELFDENNAAVRSLISSLIHTARHNDRAVGLCGQAPSDNAEFAKFLVHEGIDSISFTPDSLLNGIHNIAAAEKDLFDERA